MNVHIHIDMVARKEKRTLGPCLPPAGAQQPPGSQECALSFFSSSTVVYAFCKGFVEKGRDKEELEQNCVSGERGQERPRNTRGYNIS